MILILMLLPAGWFVLLFLLGWLEERTLAPDERAATINSFLMNDEPEKIEQEVAALLSRAAPRAPHSA
ncbi:MAG TPA: hypothetical protein VND22_04540 [Actinomycetota bacterium]|nr:hypothetical protein [Actinomycetota bacterium]